MKSTRKLIGTMAALAIASSASLHAAVINFTFNDTGSDVASIFKTVSGVSVTVTAHGREDSPGTDWNTRSISRNGSAGMGVDASDDSSHTIDNVGRNDFLLFQFSQPVDVNSFTMGFIDNDSDFRWAVGSPVGSTTSILNSLYGAGLNVNGGSSAPATHNINASNSLHTYLLIGASPDSANDHFKISAVNVTTGNNVPDGGSSVLLLGAALAGLGVVARRKRV